MFLSENYYDYHFDGMKELRVVEIIVLQIQINYVVFCQAGGKFSVLFLLQSGNSYEVLLVPYEHVQVRRLASIILHLFSRLVKSNK